MNSVRCIQVLAHDGQFSLRAFDRRLKPLRRHDIRLRLLSLAPRIDEIVASSQGRSCPHPRWGSPVLGEVVDMGSAAGSFHIGQTVMAVTTDRQIPQILPEYLSVPQAHVVPTTDMPDDALGYSVLTDALMSFSSLRDAGQVKVGQRVLILAATSAPGFIGVQVARSMGACPIVMTDVDHAQALRSAGASEAWEVKLSALMTRLQDIHVVYDPLGQRTLTDIEPCLAPSGRYISPVPGIRRAFDQVWSQATARLVNGIHVSRLVERRVEPRDLSLVGHYLIDGKLSPNVVDSLSLRDLFKHQVNAWERHPHGRINLVLG